MPVTSVIEPVNQAVTVSLPVPVLGRQLTYRSDWSAGRRAAYRWSLDGLAPTVEEMVEIAGTRTPVVADDSGVAVFVWDGRDSSGATVGRSVASLASDGTRRMRLGRWDAVTVGLGGMMIDPCDHLDVAANRIQSGTGVLHGSVSVFQDDGQFIVTRGGGRIESRFDSSGRHLSTTDRSTGIKRWAFSYDDRGLVAIDHHSRPEIRCVRDSGLVTLQSQDWSLVLALDDSGRAVSIADLSGRQVSLEYSSGGLLTRLVDGGGFEWAYDYDDDGRLIGFAEPGCGAAHLIRTETDLGHKVVVVSAEGRESSYQVERLPDGTRVRTSRCCGEPPSVTRIGNDQTETDRADGITIRTTRSGTVTERRVVLPSGLDHVRLVDGEDVTVNGRTFRASSGAQGVSMVSPEGRSAALERTENGYVVTDAAGQAYEVALDEYGRTVEFSDGPVSTRVRYGPHGLVSSLESSDGSLTTFEYDDFGWLTAQRLDGSTVVELERDGAGLVKSVQPPGRASTTFSYAAPGQISGVNFPSDSGVEDSTDYERDLDGLITLKRTAGGETVSFRRSVSGEVEEISGAELLATFDHEHGRVVAGQTSAGVSTHIVYDGPLITSIGYSGCGGGELEYEHANDLRIRRVKCGPLSVSYSHDADGAISSVGGARVQRDSAGRIESIAAGEITQTYSYDDFSRISRMNVDVAGTSVWTATYGYDSTGRIGSIDDTQVGGTVRYRYDRAGRLTGADDPQTRISATFDANGGLVSFTDGGRTIAGEVDQADRLLAMGASVFEYGPGGVLTREEGEVQSRRYRWDTLGRLIRVTTDGGTDTTYSRSAFGSLVEIDPSTGPAVFLVPGAHGSPVAVVDEDGDPLVLFGVVSGSEPPIVAVEPGRTLFLASDHVGSIRFVIDVETGEIVHERRYDAWGRGVTDEGGSSIPFGFAGGIEDTATGLVHFPARTYDPATMRWLSRDPLLFLGGSSNLYAYADNDPVNRKDPTGRKVEICRQASTAIPLISGEEHWWIRTASSEAGMFPDPVVTGGWLPNTVVSDHTGMGDAPDAECDPVENVDEECVDKNLATNKTTPSGVKYGRWIGIYGIVGGTCQNFVDDVLDSCSGGDYEVTTSDPDAYDHWYSPDVTTVEAYNDGYDYSFNTPSPLWE